MSRRLQQYSSSSSSSSSSNESRLRSPVPADIYAFRAILDQQPGSVLLDANEVESYNTDWTKHYKGTSSIVLRPKCTQDVSKILAYCHTNRIGVVPQAGNTGLVGGSIPMSSSEIIVSVERMKDIISFDPTTGILTGQAGGILQDWQDYARDNRVILSIDLGSKGSCCIGGTVSTNAGGQYYARYKSLHANVVGLEVVLANGDILNFNIQETDKDSNSGSTVFCNLKDNTGYDLKHLFIGAEGSLGIITKVALWCSSSYPQSRCAVICACTSLEQVQKCLYLARQTLGETLSAFEFMDRSVTHLVANSPNSVTSQRNAATMIPKRISSTSGTDGDDSEFYPYYILVETHGSNSLHDDEKMERFLEESIQQNAVEDGVLAQDLTQLESMWAVRESCNPTVASHGYTYKYDVSLPISDFEDFANDLRRRLDSKCSSLDIAITNWGHIMDGNLHFNVTTLGKFDMEPKVLEALEPYIFESVIRRGGSISAEHGLGQAKNKYLPKVHGASTLALMKTIKQVMDPHGIMNPGKYLPLQL